jgi:Methyltransferase domain/PEP-CTERM motif
VLLLSRRYKRALDLGCGLGNLTGRLRNHADRVLGIDLSHVAIAQATRDTTGRAACNSNKGTCSTSAATSIAALAASAPAWGDEIDSNKAAGWGTRDSVALTDSANAVHPSWFVRHDEHRDWSHSHDWKAWWAEGDDDLDKVPGNNQSDASPVATPEPATVWMLGVGLIGLLGAATFGLG